MALKLTAALLNAIERHAEAAYPHEGCGILLGRVEGDTRTVTDILPVENQREEAARRNRYLIPPEVVADGEEMAEQKGLEVIGFFHSPPDHPARPSAFDREHAWPWYSYVITSVERGRASGSRAWRLLDDRSQFVEEEMVYA